jgi:hypothetical protein
MNPELPLKIASLLFALLWTCGMIFWTGTETANIVILAVCGGIGGVLWYLCMRKVLQ